MPRYITGSTPLVAGIPMDSLDPNHSSFRPRYFMSLQTEINMTWQAFVSPVRSRSGEQFSIRKDDGYYRSLTCALRADNPEMVQWFEWYFRERTGEIIMPIWCCYLRILSQTGQYVALPTTNEDLAVGDYVLLLRDDFSTYSIRQISAISVLTGIVTLNALPGSVFSPNDFFIPMMLGYPSDTPKFSYTFNRDQANVNFVLQDSGQIREVLDWTPWTGEKCRNPPPAPVLTVTPVWADWVIA